MADKSSFEKVRAGLRRAIEHAGGERALTTREVELPESPKPLKPSQIIRLRRQTVGVSQAVFAKALNSSVQTVQAWEQGRTKPSGPALRFLRLIESDPRIIKVLLKPSGGRRKAAKRAGKRRVVQGAQGSRRIAAASVSVSVEDLAEATS